MFRTLYPTLTAMRRDLPRLAESRFDLLVIGAGIYGACAAWDASLRGLSVAVVDRTDFGAGTSANSLRIVHGGLRYLARGDFSRMRESIKERSTLLRIAPNLVQPLEILVPTYGSGTRGRLAHAAALRLNDLVSFSRNRHLDRSHQLKSGHLVSRQECLASFPWFPAEGLTGGAVWHDAQLRHPERLTLSFIRSAATIGAVPLNYLQVDHLLVANGTVQGAQATDLLTGAQMEILARAVLVAGGPWTDEILATAGTRDSEAGTRGAQAMGLNLVVNRRLAKVGIGVQSRSGPQEDTVCGGQRFLFCAPCGRGTVLGTWYTGDIADPVAAHARGVRALLQEFNDACPGLKLSQADVIRSQWGWLPLKSGREPGRPGALAERPRITDHGPEGIKRLISVEGVKFTTARLVAEQAIDRVFTSLGRPSPVCLTAERKLDNGAAEPPPGDAAGLGREDIVRAVRQEMAVKLSDVVLRRAGFGVAPAPARATVEAAARVMAAELGWDAFREGEEIQGVLREHYPFGTALETVA